MTDLPFEEVVATSVFGDDAPLSLDDTLTLWIGIPRADDHPLGSWTTDAARVGDTLRQLDDAQAQRLATLLSALEHEPRPVGYSWRLLFMIHPALGATVVDVAFLDVGTAADARTLVAADEPAQMGSDVVPFERQGVAGLQCVQFGLVPVAGEPESVALEQAIEATARVTVTRDLPAGRTTLLALARSAHLESLLSTLEPLQHLLTSEFLVDLLTTPQPPSGMSA